MEGFTLSKERMGRSGGVEQEEARVGKPVVVCKLKNKP